MPQTMTLGRPTWHQVKGANKKNRSRTEAVHPSSQAIPITRPFAPHLVVLEENGSA
ncbi:hypothetical protein SynMITS9220_01840 [Synechococcus sp. MIT S9220]|nr:hypothetical protein SynMITS9220_01840 [Synechococcus sp. MIT S9220]